jgi:hypothetical protein
MPAGDEDFYDVDVDVATCQCCDGDAVDDCGNTRACEQCGGLVCEACTDYGDDVTGDRCAWCAGWTDDGGVEIDESVRGKVEGGQPT